MIGYVRALIELIGATVTNKKTDERDRSCVCVTQRTQAVAVLRRS